MKKLIYTVLGLVTLFSCSEDYLETKSSELLSHSDITENSGTRPELLDGFLNGLYTIMYSSGSGGTTGHDDFGQRGYDLFTDLLQGDVVLGGLNYGWYSGISNHSVTTNFRSTRNYTPWRYNYAIIFGANGVIDGFNLSENGYPTGQEEKSKLGQALAMRAYSYYNLVNMFVEDNHVSSAEAIPVYTTISDEAAPKSTVGEVYTLIINDLEKAVELLDGFDRKTKKHKVDQSVALGMLANAYAAVGKNSEAAMAAKKIIDSGKFPLTTKEQAAYDPETQKGGGFNDVTTPSWIWGIDLDVEMGVGLISWWGQVDRFTYSYAWAGDPKVINIDLYNKMPEDDVRRKQFVSRNASEPNKKYPSGKFFAPCRTDACQNTIETDYLYMRVDEMYLLYAETAAKSGNEAGAKDALKSLLAQRVDNPSYVDGLSGQALMDEILLQQRLELWGEGKLYNSMKRNKQTITYGSNHLYFSGQSFQYNDPKLTFEVPLSEVQNNPHIN